MEFRQSIRQLEKQYYNLLKGYYNTNKLILKMIAMHNASELSEPDICFRTCDIYSFSDKHINRLYEKNPKNAVHCLRVRSVCCMYTAQSIDIIINNCTRVDDKGVKFIKELTQIRDALCDLARTSVNLSNSWAKKYRLSYMTFDDNYTFSCHQNYDRGYYDSEYCDREMWDIDKFK